MKTTLQYITLFLIGTNFHSFGMNKICIQETKIPKKPSLSLWWKNIQEISKKLHEKNESLEKKYKKLSDKNTLTFFIKKKKISIPVEYACLQNKDDFTQKLFLNTIKSFQNYLIKKKKTKIKVDDDYNFLRVLYNFEKKDIISTNIFFSEVFPYKNVNIIPTQVYISTDKKHKAHKKSITTVQKLFFLIKKFEDVELVPQFLYSQKDYEGLQILIDEIFGNTTFFIELKKKNKITIKLLELLCNNFANDSLIFKLGAYSNEIREYKSRYKNHLNRHLALLYSQYNAEIKNTESLPLQK